MGYDVHSQFQFEKKISNRGFVQWTNNKMASVIELSFHLNLINTSELSIGSFCNTVLKRADTIIQKVQLKGEGSKNQ